MYFNGLKKNQNSVDVHTHTHTHTHLYVNMAWTNKNNQQQNTCTVQRWFCMWWLSHPSEKSCQVGSFQDLGVNMTNNPAHKNIWDPDKR